MVLSMADVAGLAYDAGLRNPAKIAQAVAIASAESGRDPGRLGDTALQNGTWGPSVGLWQIRSLKAEQGKGTTRDADVLKDPARNAKAMVEISHSGATWEPWTVTHPTNLLGFARYKAALPGALLATNETLVKKGAGIAGDKAEEAAGAVLDPIENLAGTISDAVQTPVRVANWLTESGSWVRIAYVVGGGLLLVLALTRVVQGPAMNAAGKIVQTVIPAGKAAKLVKKVA